MIWIGLKGLLRLEREILILIHQYINNGYHIVLDVNSGSVHVVDPVVYDAIAAVSEQVPEMDKPEKLSEEVTANVHKKLDETYGSEMVCEALEDIQELIDQWKTVVVTLAGMLGILVVILTVGTVILGKETAAVAAPPLTGGFVAAMMMQSVAPTEHLAILAMAVYVLQGFVGYPLTSICLKKEGYSVLKQYRQGTWKAAAVKEKANDDSAKNYLFPQIPDKYKSDFTYLFTMVILTVMSGYLDKLSGGYISKFVWALILGVFAAAMGFIEKNVLVRSRSMGFVYTIIMMFVFSQLRLQVSSAQHPVLYSLQALLWQCSLNKRRFHHGFRFKR